MERGSKRWRRAAMALFLLVAGAPVALVPAASSNRGGVAMIMMAASAAFRGGALAPARGAKAPPSVCFAGSTAASSCIASWGRRRGGPGTCAGTGANLLLSMSSGEGSGSGGTAAQQVKTLAKGSHRSEMEVKKSRFVAYAKRVGSWKDAQSYIASVKSEHPKARHWCYGFRCGCDPVTERCSDDGEPSGTAGPPILGAIKGEDLSDAVCVVVRYFGGVKLGAGGLIRAYGASARQVLREAPTEVLIPTSSVRVRVDDPTYIGSVYEVAARIGADAADEKYGEDGSLTVTLTCEASAAERLRSGLSDSTRGSATFPDDATTNTSTDDGKQ